MRPGPLAINAKAAAAATALALALAAVPAGASPNGAAERFYERSFVLAADARCRLFEPRLTHALEAATWQARGAALRHGTAAASADARGARAGGRVGSRALNLSPCARKKAQVRPRGFEWNTRNKARVDRALAVSVDTDCQAPLGLTEMGCGCPTKTPARIAGIQCPT